GGYNASWSYGIPSLPNIVSNGSPCFATGDAGVAQNEPFTTCLPVPGPTLIGNYYNCCERSFVESPSINLTGISSPLLSFDFNLFCEQTYDGSKVQLSIDGGSSWQDIGTYNSGTFQTFPSSVNCRETNWYNKNNINYLTGTSGGCGAVSYSLGGNNSGWSGGCAQAASGACLSPDVHGTNGWIQATHCIPAAANKPDVKIRFAFGAGSQVFSDGIAFDNVKILNVFPVVNFAGAQVPSCDPEFAFQNNSDCAQSWNWNFGHPSFPGNTSTDQDPVHIFPAAGSYSVTLTAVDFCGGSTAFSKQITVADGNGPVIDSVTTSGSGLCNSAMDTLSIYLSSMQNGTPPYEVSYSFNGTPNTVSSLTGNPILITGLQAGVYSSINITDAGSCEDSYSGNAQIPYNGDSLQITISNDTTITVGGEVNLSVTANISSSFQWTPTVGLDDPSSANPIASPDITTTYSVVVTDINGCSENSSVTVFVKDEQKCDAYFSPNSFTPNGDGKNEKFNIQVDPAMRIADFQLQIYNRWGGLVFESNSVTEGWDGNNSPQGTYLVKAEFTCRNKKKSVFTGSLKLIR
nr:gliding motility-associated C-terminal domain-containing protein [Bacteroidia bacterium]